MFKPIYTNKALKDIKLAQKRGLNIQKLKNVIALLCESEELPKQCRPHILSGKYDNYWGCKIRFITKGTILNMWLPARCVSNVFKLIANIFLMSEFEHHSQFHLEVYQA